MVIPQNKPRDGKAVLGKALFYLGLLPFYGQANSQVILLPVDCKAQPFKRHLHIRTLLHRLQRLHLGHALC